MEEYHIQCSNGWQHTFKAKSERAAKMYATKQLSHGCGNMTLCRVTSEYTAMLIAARGFWSSLNSFGWDNWK